MGTNYFYETGSAAPCPTCGRAYGAQRLHIGKASAGWTFSLHIIPEQDIRSLEDWQRVWATGAGQIRDEYGEFIPVPEMLEIITQRSHPTGLRRGRGEFCQLGEPTFELIEGDFS